MSRRRTWRTIKTNRPLNRTMTESPRPWWPPLQKQLSLRRPVHSGSLMACRHISLTMPSVTDSKPAHITSTGESDTPPIAEATKENTHPSGVTPEASPANNEAKSHPVVSRGSSEDKIPVNVHEEPPPIRRVQAVPGMSATSGPLEDYPEGGDFS